MNLPQNIAPTVLKNHIDDWENIIKIPLSKREHYKKEDHFFSYGIIAGRILGTPLVEEEYFNLLYHLSIETNPKFHILSEELDKSITPERFQAIQDIILINQKKIGLSLNRVIAFMEGKQLIPRHENPNFHRHVQYTLIDTLKHFEVKHPKGLADPNFRRVFIDLVKWLWNHWDPWIREVSIVDDMPKVIWYGEASKSQLYFLYFLIKVGCDVLIFDPTGHDLFAEIDPNEDYTFTFSYKNTMKYKPFPKEHQVQRTTVAYHASKEIEQLLYHESSNLYKPWQFRSYIPSSITLKTTYDEVFLIVKEEAYIRPNFKVTAPNIQIPSIFTKISGVSSDKKEYWDRIQNLSDYELGITIKEFPFTTTTKANYLFHYQHSLNREGFLDPEKMTKGHYWKYSHLSNDLQVGLATVISRYCSNPKLKPKVGESLEDLKVFLFMQALFIPEKFLILLQKFDYSKRVPRVVLFNTEKNGMLSRTDAALLLLLHEFGFDIFLYSPTAQNDIEHFVDASYFSTFMLENVEFDQEFQERDKSIIKKILRNFL